MEPDFAIEKLIELKNTLQSIVDKWENSEYSETEFGQDMINGTKKNIEEVEDEIKAWQEYKRTGVFISRKARNAMKKLKNKDDDEEYER